MAVCAPTYNMANRILIIQPSYYRSKADRTVFKVRRRQVVPLTLPYLAALTPARLGNKTPRRTTGAD